MSAPAAPPQYNADAEAAKAAAGNKATAVTQYGLNATNQVTPYGNLNYEQIGKWDDGTPRFQSTQTLSPEEQNLYNTYTSNQQKLGAVGGQQIDKVSNLLSTPWSLDNATADKLSGMQKQFLDPEWNTRESGLDTKLANQGITPGSEAWNTQKQRFSTDRSRAYDDMYLNAYNTGQQASLTQRNQPLNEITALMSGSQVQQPSFTNTPQVQVAPTDYLGASNTQYQGQMQGWNSKNQYNQALMGGLFGIAGAGAGGWARGSFKTPGMG